MFLKIVLNLKCRDIFPSNRLSLGCCLYIYIYVYMYAYAYIQIYIYSKEIYRQRLKYEEYLAHWLKDCKYSIIAIWVPHFQKILDFNSFLNQEMYPVYNSFFFFLITSLYSKLTKMIMAHYEVITFQLHFN